VTIAAQLTYHITVPALGAKGKPKEKKEQKTKELKHSFTPTTDNYIDFLKALLAKHGEEKYNITSKKRFSFKALVAPSKAYVFFLLSRGPNLTPCAEKGMWSILTTSRTSSSSSPNLSPIWPRE
jgi:lipocalin